MKTNTNLTTTAQDRSISTIDLLWMVNEARVAAGESEIENRHFVARVEDELGEDIPTVKVLRSTRGGGNRNYYDLTADQALLVGMRESKSVRKRVLERLRRTEKELMHRLEQDRKAAIAGSNKAIASSNRAIKRSNAAIEKSEAAIEKSEAAAVNFVERATQAEENYKRLGEARAVELSETDEYFLPMDAFVSHHVERRKDGSILMRGSLGNEEGETLVLNHRERHYMEEFALCRMFGVAPGRLKKMTYGDERRPCEGTMLYDTNCVPKLLKSIFAE